MKDYDKRLELEMENAHLEKMLNVQKKIGEALHKMPISDVLYVLADLTKTILDSQEPARRKKNCELFVKMISTAPSPIIMADENGRIMQ